ncbi:MAG TPA: DUF1801 domain-containing protein [Solirubrobacteraceae bacterium]|jgi:uncharacterized protein YdhG (YjbR/CyaY superfamily)|nr:DUF1801 domain-containing protein [Solirubrobacteraceae bacterium]
MAERQAAKTTTRRPVKRTAGKASAGFTAEEKAAMRERAKEMKRAASDSEGESDVLKKIAEMGKTDRAKAKRVHAIVKATAPELAPRTWYGMPAYTKDGKPVCFFKPADKFKMRYATFEFSDNAKLDSGAMWPIGFALKEMNDDVEAKIASLVKKAVG